MNPEMFLKPDSESKGAMQNAALTKSAKTEPPLSPFSEDQIWDSYNTLLMSQDVDRVRKILVRYELYKKTIDVPGDILECGVFKGAGLMYWLKLLTIYEPSSLKRVVGFDTFNSFADSLQSYEKESVKEYVGEAHFEGIRPSDLLKRAADAKLGNRVELVQGDLQITAAEYIKRNPGFRISLLNMDVDTYVGSKAILENFYDSLSRGGVIIFDEYASRGWGESDAVDEFFADKDIVVKTVPFSSKPVAYVVKH